MTEKELIESIREHKLIGRGTCSVVDECYDNGDLWRAFGPEAGNSTLDKAIASAIEACDMFVENGLNQRWGEDGDPQLLMYDDCKKEMGL